MQVGKPKVKSGIAPTSSETICVASRIRIPIIVIGLLRTRVVAAVAVLVHHARICVHLEKNGRYRMVATRALNLNHGGTGVRSMEATLEEAV